MPVPILPQRSQALGGAKVILITASGGTTVATTFKGLRPGGVFDSNVGVGPEPIECSSIDLTYSESAKSQVR